MRDGLINNFAFVVSGLVGIILVPLMLRWLGAKAYGIWIVAMAVTGILGTADLGLYSTVVHEVSSSFCNGPDAETWLFVEGAGNAYLLLGISGGLLLGALGYILSDHFHVGLQLESTARMIFWLMGLGFLVDQLNLFGGAILIGVRRFGYVNLIRSVIAILRAAGIVILLAAGGSLISIALWQAVATAIGTVFTFLVIHHSVPQFRFRLARLHWARLRQRLSFAISSLLTTLLGGLAWRSGSLLIGLAQGSASVVPFYIGRKLPYAAATSGWQAAESMFPAVAENQDNLLRTREILRVGTRWVLVLITPVVILLCLVGPNLLRLWIGNLDPQALRVLELLSLAAMADAFMAASLNVLWGRAAMRKVLLTLTSVGLGTVCLTLLLLPRVGVTGAAWGVLLPMASGACALFYWACRECQAGLIQMTRSVFRGLLLPIVACAVIVFLVSNAAGRGLGPLIGTCVAGTAVYILMLYTASGQSDEKQFLQRVLRRVASFQ